MRKNLKEEGLLGKGMSKDALNRDTEESDRQYIIQKQKKAAKVFTIKTTRSSSYPGANRPDRYSYQTGTLEELIKAFSYTLEVGASWQHEKGNKKINRNPNTPQALVINLYNAKNNAAANGYSGYNYELVPNEENPNYKKEIQESFKRRAIISLIESYTGKKVVLKENAKDGLLSTSIKDIQKYKVGDTFISKKSSSSPPAVWTENYTVTRVDNTGVYGVYDNTSSFREFEGWEME